MHITKETFLQTEFTLQFFEAGIPRGTLEVGKAHGSANKLMECE